MATTGDAMAADKADFPLLERGEAVAVVALGPTPASTASRLSRTVTVVAPTAPPMHWHLVWAGIAGNLAAVCGGFVYSWPSPSLPRLRDADAPLGFVLTPEQASWVVSLTPLGGAFGTIPGGLFADRFGRRPTLICSAALMFVCWVMTGLANSAAWLYAARFIGGFVTGVVSCILPLYLGEIAVDRIRAALGCAMQLSLTLGFMLPYALGPFVTPTVLAVVLASCVAVYAAASLSLPESPYLLLLKGETEAASAALQWLRGQDRDQCYKELRRMEEETEACLARRCSVAKTFVRVFETRGGRRAFLLVCALMLFQQLSGINAVLSYAEDIFNRAAGGEAIVSPAMSTIIVGLVLVVASASTVPLTAGVSMKMLFIVSSLGAAVAHTALGYFFYLVRTGQDTSSLSALPVASLVFFIVVYCLGLGSVPWALLGEVFVADVKAASSSLCASFYWAVGFLVTLFFHSLMDNVGADLTFWGLAACCVLAAVFTLALVPNTKGKSLQEIQDILNGRDASTLPATPRLSRLLRDQ